MRRWLRTRDRATLIFNAAMLTFVFVLAAWDITSH